MKKVLVVVLVLSLAICFAACKRDNDDTATTGNALTASLPINYSGTSGVETDSSGYDFEDLTATQEENSMIVLTTRSGQTMPTVTTTMFVPQPVTTSPYQTTSPGGIFTVPTMSAPTVLTSSQTPYTYSTVSGGGTVPAYITTTRSMPTYATTTLPSSPYTAASSAVPSTTSMIGTLPTTTRPTTTSPTTTSAVTRSSKTVVINDYATTTDKKLVVTIDPTGWDGAFQNNSQNITVKIDGVSKSAPATVKSTAKDAAGNQYITIDLSELSVPEGANVQFTVPSAFLQTTSGAQYNSAFSGAYTMM